MDKISNFFGSLSWSEIAVTVITSVIIAFITALFVSISKLPQIIWTFFNKRNMDVKKLQLYQKELLILGKERDLKKRKARSEIIGDSITDYLVHPFEFQARQNKLKMEHNRIEQEFEKEKIKLQERFLDILREIK